MTRVNIVPPAELFDQHLMAEYRELPMIPAALARTLRSRKGLRLDEYPRCFTLGRGHVSFFYDKGRYLERRYAALARELTRRGFKLDPARLFPTGVFIDHNLYNGWRPTDADLALIRDRLAEKLALRPGWYRKTPVRSVNGFYLRSATSSDVPALKALFQGTVTSVNRRDYSAAETADWASCGDDENRWRELIETLDFIAVEDEDGEVVGFASLSAEGCLHSMFVHKDFQRRGVASLLYAAIERRAAARGLRLIRSEVSLTARPFFEKMGFAVDEEQQKKANRLRLTNYRMSKKLETGGSRP